MTARKVKRRRYLPPRMLWRILGLLVFWAVFIFGDPLGLETAARAAVEQFFSAAAAPFHDLSDDPASSEIAVVEVTAGGHSWPIPLADHARNLAAILQADPKAVFVDLRFADREPSDVAVFGPAIQTAEAKGVPLLFARGGWDWSGLPGPLAELGTINSWQGDARDYPLQIRHPAGSDKGRAGEAGEVDEVASPTAAFQLYRMLCQRSALPGRCDRDIDDAQFERVLHVRWGSSPDRWQGKFSGGCQTDQSPIGRLRAAATYAALSTFHVTQQWALQRCRPFLTMRDDQIGLALTDHDTIANSQLLAGRTVFYGAAIKGDHDLTLAPVLGMVPGVHQHAAAFENLLLYRSRYFAKPASVVDLELFGVDFEVTTVELVQLVVWVVFLIGLFAGGLDLLAKLRSIRSLPFFCLPGIVVAGLSAFAVDMWQSGRPPSALPIFGLLYGMLVLASALVVRFGRRRSYLWHTLTIIVLAFWGFVANELWLRLPTTEWLGFIFLYLAISETIEADENSAEAWFGAERHTPHRQLASKGSRP